MTDPPPPGQPPRIPSYEGGPPRSRRLGVKILLGGLILTAASFGTCLVTLNAGMSGNSGAVGSLFAFSFWGVILGGLVIVIGAIVAIVEAVVGRR